LLWSAEEHATGNVHLHALSVTTPAVWLLHAKKSPGIESSSRDWSVLKENWYAKWGIARIFPYDPRLKFGAERYVTKYVLAETCLDWGIEEW